ncbi:hypothetical protein [uncultured Kordia sp.]|uniref:hypothetical protein n=1 Tax=uncultured Kordia sp. TaxID=507699 RepID=UPI0026077FDB|nr:hypothetical protein [uncultured Kordia sp.]
MKKQRKLLLKRVNIAPINQLQFIKGGGGETQNPLNNCVSEQTDPIATCVASVDMVETCKGCKTGTTRGNGSI